MKGIVIACPKKYENICLNNIRAIRSVHKCNLPIEIWEIGQEISPQIREEIKKNSNIIFKNVNHFCNNPQHWKGFQVKVFALHNSQFDEAILCDADVTFLKSPEIVFSDEHYIRTGAYFFRDLEEWKFHNLSNNGVDKFQSLQFFNGRKQFFRHLMPEKSPFFPPEFDYIYSDDVPSEPAQEALQESGVVYINLKIHEKSMERIYFLNYNHKITYNYVWGDKETFWIGCVMAGKEYYFNPTAGYMHGQSLTHNYGNERFWKQK
jgi:hypothetical protein